MLVFLTACGQRTVTETKAPIDREDRQKLGFGSLMSDDALTFGPGRKGAQENGPSPTVNTFLWRASLDVLSFMPLTSADASGGILLTDWYIAPDRPAERLKVRVLITSRVLRADAVKVSVYKQVKDNSGQWVTATVDTVVSTDLETLILSKARELRINSLGK